MTSKRKRTAYEEIGERIRDIRKRKGLTQAQLVGGEITRNMLSRIENGVALPSLPTLCAIADGLGVPASLLLGELDGYESYKLGAKLRTLVDSGNFEAAIKLFESNSHADITEDIKFSLANAFIGYADICYAGGRMNEAKAFLDKARAISDVNDQARVLYGLIAISELADTGVEAYDSDEKIKELAFDSNVKALYLYALKSLDKLSKEEYAKPHEKAEELCAFFSPIIEALSDSGYRAHIDAKLDMISADYLSAKAKLIKALSHELTVPLLWSIYTDLEFCCKCCYDFENAYKYSTLRLELVAKIK